MARQHRRYRQPTLHERHALDLPFNALVASAVVPDPYSTIGEQIAVTRSIRDDPLAGMLSRRVIDQAQFAAGRRFEMYYETAGIGLVVAIDPTKEPVDGGGASRAGFTDAQLYAFHKLKEARAVLGLQGYGLVCRVLGDGQQIQQIALECGVGERAVKYLGLRLRECLETLAGQWGLASKEAHPQSSQKFLDSVQRSTPY